MAKPSLPITLQIGDITAGEIGAVDVPLISRPASKDAAGQWQIEFHVDHPELRRLIADLLRNVADEFEKGPANG